MDKKRVSGFNVRINISNFNFRINDVISYFSYGWGGKESSGNPLNAFYRGPEPFSEPESRAIRVTENFITVQQRYNYQ